MTRPHRSSAPGPRVHRRRDPRARLPAQRARDRRGRRALLELHGPRPPRRPPGQGLPQARPDQAPGDRARLRVELGPGHRAPTRAPHPARRRRGGRHRRARAREHRGERPRPRGLHRRRPALHGPRPGRLDGRRRHPRRRLRRRAPAARRRPRRGRGRRHPRRGGDGQDVPPPSRQGRPAPREPDDERDGLRARATCRSTARSSPLLRRLP